LNVPARWPPGRRTGTTNRVSGQTELAVPIGSLAIVIVDHDDKSPAAHCFERMLECGKSGWLWKNGRANGFDIFTVSKPSVTGRVNHRAALTITPALRR